MGSHPLNLLFRFLLEITALVSVGMWGWRQADGWLKIVLALALPLILAVVWGVFAVPGDPSRSGNTIVAVPGLARLVIELLIFAAGVWAVYDMGYEKVGMTMMVVVMAHYLLSYDRIIWLIAQ